MIGKKIVSSMNLPLFEVNELLSARHKEGELTYEQQHALDYSKKFSKITPAKGEKLTKELRELGLDEDSVTKIVDILPQDLETARLIVYKSAGISEEKLKQAVELVSKCAAK